MSAGLWRPPGGDATGPLGYACAWLALSFYTAVLRGQGMALWVLGLALGVLGCMWLRAREWWRA